MELILLAIGGIVWAVIKILSQPPPQAPRPSGRTPVSPPSKVRAFVPAPARASARPEPVSPPAAPFFEPEEEENWFNPDSIAQGFIMAELLGPPLAKRPRRRQAQ
jgi:hypothetical protein